jgi:hypothetical protein
LEKRSFNENEQSKKINNKKIIFFIVNTLNAF